VKVRFVSGAPPWQAAARATKEFPTPQLSYVLLRHVQFERRQLNTATKIRCPAEEEEAVGEAAVGAPSGRRAEP
jgi:hypothetical protein